MLIWVALKCFFSGLSGAVIGGLASNGETLNDHRGDRRNE